jgi:hypothetical protein
MNKGDPERAFCSSPEEEWGNSDSSEELRVQESPKAEYIDIDEYEEEKNFQPTR